MSSLLHYMGRRNLRRLVRPYRMGIPSLKSSITVPQRFVSMDTKANNSNSMQNQQSKSKEASSNFLKRMPERLVSEGDGLKPTMAARQFDTLGLYQRLSKEGFTADQSEAIILLLLEILDDLFYKEYNHVYLNDMELENQSHLFHAAESELKYAIQNSRDTQLNNQHLQLMKLIRDLEALHDEMNEMSINCLQKDSKVDFNNQKIENTLLQRQIKLELSDCINKISTKILGKTRSDIENLRWQTTRSGLLAVLILVFFMVGGASISNRISAEKDKPMQVTLHTVDSEEHEDSEENYNDNGLDQMLLDDEDINPDTRR